MGRFGRFSAILFMSFSFLLSTVLFSFASGQPQPWQMGLSESVTPIMTELLWFHDDFLLWIIGFVTFFVLFLLIVVVLFFNKRFHPVPSTTSHNTAIEVIWTVIPILILIVIAVPSFRLLYFERVIPEAAMTIKAIGHQWYWSYEYPDHEDVSFDSVMVEDEDLKAGQPRLLAVDQELIVPVGKVVRLLVTASDVIHSWAIPSFGMKIDAIPGRLNESWFKAEKVGVYYGQCSELCGVRHAFMPIAVRVVEQEIFDAWITMAVQSGPEDANELLTHRHKILSRTVSLKNGG